jgi:GNAT superfamily N-acetyltransferase
MEEKLEVISKDQPAWDVIGGGITDYNNKMAGDDKGKNLCFVLQSQNGEVVGGIIGSTNWNWLYINLMWIKEEFRHKGFGHQLMIHAEEEARKRGAMFAHLDTFSFQAPEFYKKHGYKVFGELNDFPAGHKRYFLMKELHSQ